VEDGRIVDQGGQPVQLRGMSLFWSMGRSARQFYNANVIKWIASDWQAGIIRAAMGVETNFWTDEPGYITDPSANRQRVIDVVEGAIQAGIYVIIDWHSHDAESYEQQSLAFFRDMATRYKDVPNVLYEIYNEPINGTTEAAARATWQAIKPYSQNVTNAIRAIDPHNIVIIGTPVYCQRPDVAVNDPIEGANLAYSAHFYAGQNSSAHRQALRSRIFYAMSKGFAVFVTEFGITASTGNGAINTAESDIWFAFLDEHKIGWANWSLSTENETSAALRSGASTAGNWNDGNLTESGRYIRNKLRSPPSTQRLFYTLTIKTVGQGTASPSSPTMYVYERGANTSVTLAASPESGWRFEGWSGDLVETAARPVITMNSDKVITATFVQNSTSVHSAAGAGGQAAVWSVRRTGAGVSLRGPAADGAVEVSFYDMRGRNAGTYQYSGGGDGREMIINTQKLPAGNYFIIVRNKITGREACKTKVLLVN
jgi:endoglucanase